MLPEEAHSHLFKATHTHPALDPVVNGRWRPCSHSAKSRIDPQAVPAAGAAVQMRQLVDHAF